MKDIFSIAIMNFLFLPIVINMNLKYSNELLSSSVVQKSMYLSNVARRVLLLRNITKSGLPKVRVLGFLHYILVTYPSLLFATVIVIFTLIHVVKYVFSLDFVWFTPAILVLSSFGLMGYSALMVVVFAFLSWILKKK